MKPFAFKSTDNLLLLSVEGNEFNWYTHLAHPKKKCLPSNGKFFSHPLERSDFKPKENISYTYLKK